MNRKKKKGTTVKRMRTRYGQAPMRHARKGVNACALSVVCVFFLVLMVGTSYAAKGDVGLFIGFLGLATLILALLGLVEAIQGFQEQDRSHRTCIIGVIANGILLLLMCALFVRGLL